MSALLVAALGTTVLPATAQAAPHRPAVPEAERVSTAADGAEADGASGAASVSGGGRYVAYDLQPQHPSDPSRVEVYDRETGTREVISDGPPDSARDMVDPSISADGRHVAYEDKGTGQVWLLVLRDVFKWTAR
ncbi:hypothetical protein [Streptomyces sp. MZ04]|uniref:hypothetical protein n=1 Tax=Streptomyces sp. MZ04 TaxID=2559236 RepID=UPI001ADF4911|nr:hypothetical protein [Streptomyces sp. MZ04]